MNIEKERPAITPNYDVPIFNNDKKEIEALTKNNEELKKIADKYSGEGYDLSPADVLDEIKAQIEINLIVEDYSEMNLKEIVETRTETPYSNSPTIILSVLKKMTGQNPYGMYKKNIKTG
jgi:hypothetical protein